jgi:hypothetical protein
MCGMLPSQEGFCSMEFAVYPITYDMKVGILDENLVYCAVLIFVELNADDLIVVRFCDSNAVSLLLHL